MRTRTRIPAPVGMVAAALSLLLASCAEPARDAAHPLTFRHVHGLGLNPATGDLWIATHDGLLALGDGKIRRVEQAPHDLMGFTVTGPDQFAASGHPTTVGATNPLGFVTSTNAGQTLIPVSLTGQADLHAIDAAGTRVVAFDAVSQTVIESTDNGRTFDRLAQIPTIDVAIAATGTVMVTTDDYTLLKVAGTQTERVASAPPLALIDGGSVWAGVSPNGLVWTSQDGHTWKGRGDLPGQPQALSAQDGHWYAATSTGIYESTDDGATWKAVL